MPSGATVRSLSITPSTWRPAARTAATADRAAAMKPSSGSVQPPSAKRTRTMAAPVSLAVAANAAASAGVPTSTPIRSTRVIISSSSL